MKKYIYHLLSFLVPITILFTAFAVFGVYPFGQKSILILDLSTQYVEFFASLRQIVLGDHSLFYTWGKSLGGNYIGIYSYYLSSPLSFLTLLFPLKNLPEAIFAINLLKIGLSGLTFSIFLKYLFKKNDLSLVVFSALYALMSFAVLYSQNIMWLDSLIWLPIVIIGVEKIIKREKSILYIVSLAVMFISCYYLSYCLGIFVLIYLVYRLLIQNPSYDLKTVKKIVLRFIGETILAVGCSAWLLLPTINALKQGKISGAYELPPLQVKFNIYQIISRLFVGSYENINNLGLPNVYCGIIVTILVILFFTNKAIEKKDKFISGIIILFFILSMTINLIDIAWHGFQSPNWFPSRYSFLFCFFLIITAYKTWINTNSNKLSHIAGTSILVFVFAFITDQLHFKYLSSQAITLTYLLIGVYLFSLAQLSKNEGLRKAITIFIFIVVIGELYFNTYAMIKGLNTQVGYRNRSDYSDFKDKMAPVIQKIQDDDKSFYRMEMNFYRGRNEAVGFGYNGITHYSSIYNQAVNNYGGKMGMAQENTRLIYNGATMWTDSLFSLKYIMSKNKINNYYDVNFAKGDVTVYQNPFALDLGFMVDEKSKGQLYNSVNPFENQNRLFSKMTGVNEECFKNIDGVKMDIQNLIYTQNGDKITFTKKKSQEDGVVYYTFTVPHDGPVYVFLTSDYDEDCQLYINDTFVSRIFDSEKQCIMYLGEFKKGDVEKAKFVMKRNSKTVNKAYFSVLNMDTFKQGIGILREDGFQISKFSDTHLEGSVKVEDKKLFFTSIPYDKGWKVTVDGKKIKPLIFDNTFICFPLTEGEHFIKMDYTSPGFMPGLLISIFSLFVLLYIRFPLLDFSVIKRKQIISLHNQE